VVRWRTVRADELDRHPDLIARLRRGEFDGLTVQGVYPPDVATRAAGNVAAYLSLGTPVVFGAALGRPLLQDGVADTTWHLDDAERVKPVYEELFGFDPHERLGAVLAPALGGLAWSTPVEGGRPYNPGNIRHMEVGGGGLAAHAGNEFLVSTADGASRHLLATTQAIDHMSYFVMLQPAEEGGELSVFERLWEDPAERGEDAAVPLLNDHEFDGVPHLAVTPAPGDLILFNAGRRYHRVEEIRGTVPRITYGGFTAPSHGGTALHCWA
jgi:hypothetical protein